MRKESRNEKAREAESTSKRKRERERDTLSLSLSHTHTHTHIHIHIHKHTSVHERRFLNVFGRRICRKAALRSGILLASPELMHRPRSDSSLHFDTKIIYQMRTEKQNASARRLLATTMRWPQVCRVKITFELLLTVCFVSSTTNSMKCLVTGFHWIRKIFSTNSNPTVRQHLESSKQNYSIISFWAIIKAIFTHGRNGFGLNERAYSLKSSLQKHFIESVFVETNDLVRSGSNMILTRQTCGQHSSRVARSKRRALSWYLSVRIRHVFSISKCRGESGLGLCMSSILAKRIRCAVSTSDF